MRIHSAILVFVLAASALSAVLAPVGASARGQLIKGSLPAVYYIADDGRRYVFPNERIYFSWYEDFSEVETVDDADLADYQIGGNVTYRPGTRLIKLTNNPKVYAVEPGGVLRWVTTEAIARSLWGTEWAKRVDDLPDGFFPAYTLGNDLDSAVYPDGSLLLDGGIYYLIENGARREVTEEGLTRNGLITSFAVSADSSGYPDGDDLRYEDDAVADTASLGLGADQEEDVLGSEVGISDTVTQGSDDAVLGRFVLSFKSETAVRNPVVTIKANKNSDSDFDEGGLVRGDPDSEKIVGANLVNIRIVDESGLKLFGAAALQTGEEDDGTQRLIISGQKTFQAGRHTLYLLANVDEDVPEGESYTATWSLAETSFLVGDDEAETVEPDALSSGSVTVSERAVALTLSVESVKLSVLRGEDGPHQIAVFDLKNNLTETVTVTELVVTGYVDEGEGNTDFSAGSDADDGVDTSVDDLVYTVYLVDLSDGATLDVTSTIGSDGRVAFEGDWEISALSTLTLAVKVELNDNAPYELGADRLAFDIAEADDVNVETSSGEDVDVTGELPNNGSSPFKYLTVSASGTLEIEGSGEPEALALMGSDDMGFYGLVFLADEAEDIEINSLSLRVDDPEAMRSIESVALAWDGGRVVGALRSGAVVFEDIGLVVPADDEVEAEVLVDIATTSTGAVSGDQIALSFDQADFSAEGATSGYDFDEDDFDDALIDSTEDGEASSVRRSMVSIDRVSGTPTSQERDGNSELIRFSLVSEGEGTAKLKKITFKIDTNEEGKSGPDNDLLEDLADINGDAQDDNGVSDLDDESTGDEVGEGDEGHIDFSIYDSSRREIDTTPAGLDTGSGDYGLVAYEFTTPLTVYTSPREYSFGLDTRGLASGTGKTIKVTILGGDDFVWSDGTTAGSNLTGDEIVDLPLAGPTVEFE
jgi:hypothetical protein